MVAAAVVGGIAAAGSVGAGLIGSSAAKKAAKVQGDAANEAAAVSERTFNKQLELNEPFRQGGLTAQNRILELLGLGPRPAPYGQPNVNAFAPGAAPTYAPTTTSAYAPTTSGAPMAAYGDGNMAGDIGMIEPGTFANAREMGIPISDVFGGYTPATRYAENATVNAPEAANTMAAPSGAAPESDFGKYARDFSMSDFEADPGYAFRQSEGMKALERSAAARGGLLSGSALKGIQRFGQDLASTEYTNAFNRYQINRNNQLNPLFSMMGAGQNSTNLLTNAAGNAGANEAAAVTNAGAARASGYVGSANALGGALSSIGNTALQLPMINAMSKYYGGSPGGAGSVVSPSLSYVTPSLTNTFSNARTSLLGG